MALRYCVLCKQNEINEVTRWKTWIVAKSYSQVEGINYTDTFAPVAHLESVQNVLSITASLDWEINQFDVKIAFLHGELTDGGQEREREGNLGLQASQIPLWATSGWEMLVQAII